MPVAKKKRMPKESAARKAGSSGRGKHAASRATAPGKRARTVPARKATGTRSATVAAGAAQTYRHDEQAVQRPEIGVQHSFFAKRPPKTYRYDSSLDPALAWDENGGRELAEWLIGLVERAAAEGEAKVFATPQTWADGSVTVENLQAAARMLRRLSAPYLNWAGKAERHQIEVPTLPLFVHERHSTKAILDGVKHRVARGTTLDLFGDANLDVTEQLSAYEHQGPWANRMILGDSLQVMSSLSEYEGLGGQVQMIYMDPPYGVRFGSNFQPFVRKRDVKHGADEQMTREPEMVKAYRDTWELGLHSYLTYMRDRLLLARELLTESGSIFVQISDENLHHLREILDEVFGPTNFCAQIVFRKTTGKASQLIDNTYDALLWYARRKDLAKYRDLFEPRTIQDDQNLRFVELRDGSKRRMTSEEVLGLASLPDGARVFRPNPLTSARPRGQNDLADFEYEGKKYSPGQRTFSTDFSGLSRLATAKRLMPVGSTLTFVRYLDDFPYKPRNDIWDDTRQSGFAEGKLYVVQTAPRVLENCVLATTDPGDLVLDPTCGSGTTAYVAEQWGRRWITCDTSRVPLALARQRLLTATFPYYDLKEPKRGPAGGFVYQRRRNQKGEEVGGLVPHVTLKSIANNEPPKTEVLVDRPEIMRGVTRVSGPFVVEATLPAAMDLEANDLGFAGAASAPAANKLEAGEAAGVRASATVLTSADPSTHIERMLHTLRQSKTLRLPGNRELTFDAIRRLDDCEHLHAEAVEKNGADKRVAVVFGPESGAVSGNLVFNATSEARHARYAHLYVFGFAIDPKALEFLNDPRQSRIPSTYVAVTPDVLMGDLLKTTRASEIFSITGLPDVAVRPARKKAADSEAFWEVEVRGLDTFNPAEMKTESVEADNLPCWMLDTDYNGLAFYGTQVFFPKTAAWDNLKRALGASLDESVWDHLAGTVSEPFLAGTHQRIAVKVIDERGNELMVVKTLGKE